MARGQRSEYLSSDIGSLALGSSERIGISRHLRPSPGVWPIDPARLPERRRWTEAYEKAAGNFASCRFIEALGSGRVDHTAAEVQRIHDELCQASSTLAIA
jgi:hypothetical protein